MKWKKMTIETVPDAEDLLVEMLSELGIDGAEVVDHRPILTGDTFEIYEDVMPKQLPDDGKAEVIFYLEDGPEVPAMLSRVREGIEELRSFTEVGSGEILESETEEEDWVNNWKAYFHPFTVEDLLIKPTWEPVPDDAEGKLLIEIDPGTAFGTGSHETTKLSLMALSRAVRPGDRVLDVGTGSGILSIVALKRGAAFAFGTDIDPLSIEAARENAEVNGIPADRFELLTGNIIDDPEVQRRVGLGCYDIAVANILADVIIPLQKEVTAHLKPGGLLLVSGIIDLKRGAVLNAFAENEKLDLLEETRMGEWIAFALRKKAN